ncbi:MAG: ABC transporter ATP-binding protein, partial [Opitutales bacterium]|nr:ABC transporter ATP-binding protein [Opitutales bacterium]
ESVSLRGESGAGKTTLLNIAAALEQPSSGSVAWNGQRIDNLGNSKQSALRSRFMAFVFQSYCLIPELNALENVLIAPRIANLYNKHSKERALALLEKVGLKDRIRHTPSMLSGGERQRVAIARALMNAPKLIMADEPTGNLDEKTAAIINEMFLELCKNDNVSLLLITHNSAFAKMTDKQLLLKDGTICNG